MMSMRELVAELEADMQDQPLRMWEGMRHAMTLIAERDVPPACPPDDSASSRLQRRLAEWLEHLAATQRNLPIGVSESERRDLRLAAMLLRDQWARIQRAEAEVYVARKRAADLQIAWDVSQKYHELLYAVAVVHPGESRHETALRYIRQAEQHIGGPTSARVTQERKP